MMPQEPEQNEGPVLRFDGLTTGFDEAPVLKNVSFEVGKGQTGIIFGAAGSGKSVLLKTAIGLVKAWSGKVQLFDQDITGLSEEQLFDVRSKVGIAFQESALFDSLTIEQNVAYPLLNQKAVKWEPKDVRPRVKEALEFVELGQTLKKFPSELSGGMRRRAAIARAVVTKPPLLLYDSPTAGLDPITAHTIISLIIKERDVDSTSALVVTHRYQDANLIANFRYNPDNGQLVGAPEETGPSTKFMVMREGSLIFHGSQQDIEASTDEYVQKFVKRPD
ncbi:MAG: transporter related [Bryobacterales bacterium]|nr:transporter related [Bryobacterales bacterium]